jgi:hypothetical protein
MPELPSSRGRAPSAIPFGVAAACCGLTAWLILSHHRLLGGLAALVAAAVLASVADRRVVAHPRVGFAGRMLDRVFEACLLAPMAWVARQGSPRVSVLALVGLGASYLASYERARGESLGYRQREGTPFRAARMAMLVVALLTGWIEALLWAFGLLTIAASAVRAANVARQERRARLAGGVRP